MNLDYFKDIIFELLNEADHLSITDIETNYGENTFTVTFSGGKIFEIECRETAIQAT